MEHASTTAVFVGIDVSKTHLDVHVRPAGHRFTLPHDAGGIDRLVEALRQPAPRLVVLEATGGFERAVAAALVVRVKRKALSVSRLAHH